MIKNIKSGFTMIELLVVISIIGILIGLSIFGLQGARTSSRDARRKADLQLIRSGLEIYRADCNVYPETLTFGESLTGSCPNLNTYIASIPMDPTDPSHEYFYSRSTPSTYILCAALENAPSPVMDVSECGSCGVTCNYTVTNP